ncbi:hypothetical protein ACA910_002285 [Epithemia clementina (nom. ined.)]
MARLFRRSTVPSKTTTPVKDSSKPKNLKASTSPPQPRRARSPTRTTSPPSMRSRTLFMAGRAGRRSSTRGVDAEPAAEVSGVVVVNSSDPVVSSSRRRRSRGFSLRRSSSAPRSFPRGRRRRSFSARSVSPIRSSTSVAPPAKAKSAATVAPLSSSAAAAFNRQLSPRTLRESDENVFYVTQPPKEGAKEGERMKLVIYTPKKHGPLLRDNPDPRAVQIEKLKEMINLKKQQQQNQKQALSERRAKQASEAACNTEMTTLQEQDEQEEEENDNAPTADEAEGNNANVKTIVLDENEWFGWAATTDDAKELVAELAKYLGGVLEAGPQLSTTRSNNTADKNALEQESPYLQLEAFLGAGSQALSDYRGKGSVYNNYYGPLTLLRTAKNWNMADTTTFAGDPFSWLTTSSRSRSALAAAFGTPENKDKDDDETNRGIDDTDKKMEESEHTFSSMADQRAHAFSSMADKSIFSLDTMMNFVSNTFFASDRTTLAPKTKMQRASAYQAMDSSVAESELSSMVGYDDETTAVENKGRKQKERAMKEKLEGEEGEASRKETSEQGETEAAASTSAGEQVNDQPYTAGKDTKSIVVDKDSTTAAADKDDKGEVNNEQVSSIDDKAQTSSNNKGSKSRTSSKFPRTSSKDSKAGNKHADQENKTQGAATTSSSKDKTKTTSAATTDSKVPASKNGDIQQQTPDSTARDESATKHEPSNPMVTKRSQQQQNQQSGAQEGTTTKKSLFAQFSSSTTRFKTPALGSL